MNAGPVQSRARRSRRALLVGALATLCAAGTAGWLALRPRQPAPLQAGLGWKPGVEYRYGLTYRASEQFAILGGALAGGSQAPGASLAGQFELEGRLFVRAYGLEGASALLGVQLADLSRHRFEAMGRDLLPQEEQARAALVGHEALVRMDPSGRIEEMRFPGSAPVLYRQTLATLLGETALDLQTQRLAWETTESNPRGEARALYRIGEPRGSSAVVEKTRARYLQIRALPHSLAGLQQQLESRATIGLVPGGPLESFTGTEKLEVTSASGEPAVKVSSTITLALEESRPFAGPNEQPRLLAERRAAVASEPPVRAGEPVETEDSRRASLERVARGMTVEMVVESLQMLPRTGPLPDDFIWRASALLALHPQACAQLAALFEDPALGPDGKRALAVLLASADVPEAQESLREALGSPTLRREAVYPDLVTELSFVKRPTAATLSMLEQADLREEGEVRVAAVYALGAAVGHAWRDGDQPAAQAANARLVGDLRASRDPARQRELLVALGNAGLAENVEAVTPLASSPAAEVRAAAAGAVRATQTERSEALLLELAADADARVQHSALSSLDGFQVRPELLGRLELLVRDGRVNELNFTVLVNLLSRWDVRRDCGSQVQALYEAMLARSIARPEIRRLVERARDGFAQSPR